MLVTSSHPARRHRQIVVEEMPASRRQELSETGATPLWSVGESFFIAAPYGGMHPLIHYSKKGELFGIIYRDFRRRAIARNMSSDSLGPGLLLASGIPTSLHARLTVFVQTSSLWLVRWAASAAHTCPMV